MKLSAVAFVFSAFMLSQAVALTLVRRQSSGCTCGDNYYSYDDIVDSINAAEDGGAR